MREIVVRSKQRLAEEREKLLARHNDGSPGPQVSAALANVVDEVVIDIYRHDLEEANLKHLEDGIAVLALGGYGRGFLAPFSDVDLMLLPSPKAEKEIGPLASQLSRDIVDAGLDLGFSVRTHSEALNWAWKDVPIFTSLSEARLLEGDDSIFDRFYQTFRQRTLRRQKKLTDAVIASRLEEREKWGETSYLLRPNVKRSRGTLRDIQLIRWLGFANFGETDIEKLVGLGVFNSDDFRHVRRGNAFLLRLRNELHFMSGKSAQDILDRHLQVAVAEKWGYAGETGVLPVEEFMRDYFEHTGEVRYASSHFRDTCRNHSIFGAAVDRALARSIGEDFKAGLYHIWVKPSSLEKVANNLTDVLSLMDIANQKCLRIRHQTWQAIRTAMRMRPQESPTGETTEHFLSLMSRPGRLADLLRRLHELRVLEQIIPAVKHARRLLQFNQYHQYTVDTHSIRAVEAVTKLIDDPGWAGDLYRNIKDKTALHVALLIHDLGKGFEEDHSEVGKRIAEQTADLLYMSEDDRDLIAWLVHRHLYMAHRAFRHDLNDPDLLTQFALEVGSPQRLDLLTLHTIGDLTAVGPEVLTDWKLNLLRELHRNTKRYFKTGELPDSADAEVAGKKQQLLDELASRNASEASVECLEKMPPTMLRGRVMEEILEELVAAETLSSDSPAAVIVRPASGNDSIEYTVVSRQDTAPIGAFSRITAALSSMGLEIQTADIETIGDSLVWDRFLVRDPDYAEFPPAGRLEEVSDMIKEYLSADDAPQPVFRKTWNRPFVKDDPDLERLPSRVTFDNETSEKSTIISLFAYDRPGLLFTIAKALANLGVVLHFAKISTHIDQVVDVFYVTELDGSKLLSSQRRQVLRDHMLQSVEELTQS